MDQRERRVSGIDLDPLLPWFCLRRDARVCAPAGGRNLLETRNEATSLPTTRVDAVRGPSGNPPLKQVGEPPPAASGISAPVRLVRAAPASEHKVCPSGLTARPPRGKSELTMAAPIDAVRQRPPHQLVPEPGITFVRQASRSGSCCPASPARGRGPVAKRSCDARGPDGAGEGDVRGVNCRCCCRSPSSAGAEQIGDLGEDVEAGEA